MEPEIIIGVLAVFVSGGAMGAAGALLGQWVLKKISGPPPRQVSPVDPRDLELLKGEMADMAVRLHSVDARLDFTEQLLGGALLGSSAPEPLPPPESSRAENPESAPETAPASGRSPGGAESSEPGADGPPDPGADPDEPTDSGDPGDPGHPGDPDESSDALEAGY